LRLFGESKQRSKVLIKLSDFTNGKPISIQDP
jgi:hypothetical protein